MNYAANALVAVYRGTAPNATGDDVDNNTTPLPGLESLPASILERTRQVFDQASGEQRTIRTVKGRLPAGLDVRAGDRVRHLVTGTLYAVDEVAPTVRSIYGARDLVLDLRAV